MRCITRDLARYFTRRFRRNGTGTSPPYSPRNTANAFLIWGGSAELWEMMNYSADITLSLNISTLWLSLPETSKRTYTAVVGDARQTDYPDRIF